MTGERTGDDLTTKKGDWVDPGGVEVNTLAKRLRGSNSPELIDISTCTEWSVISDLGDRQHVFSICSYSG